jgi:tetratricopeptide (TPR) repeat protein
VDVLNNYGMLLHTVLGEHDKAETMYQSALQANPQQGAPPSQNHFLYSGFLSLFVTL